MSGDWLRVWDSSGLSFLLAAKVFIKNLADFLVITDAPPLYLCLRWGKITISSHLGNLVSELC